MATPFPVSEDVPFMGFIIIQYYNCCALLNLGNQVLLLVCVNSMYGFIKDQY